MSKYITGQYRLILVFAALLTLLYNRVFFTKLVAAFPLAQGNTDFVIAAGLLLFLANVLFFTLAAGRYVTKPLLIFSVIAAAGCSYFMSSYGIVIDDTMLQNVLETDIGEASGLLNTGFVLQLAFFGLLPAILIWRIKLNYAPLKKELVSKAVITGGTLVFAAVTLLSFSASFASFFREYKPVRYYIAPLYAFYAGIEYAVASAPSQKQQPAKPVSGDAEIVELHDDKKLQIPDRELIFLIIGESARADHFQLNGYLRETNPALSKIDNVVSFTNFHSCGTTTAVSVPCMFSPFARKSFHSNDIYEYENVLDVLHRSGVNILWIDNNSSSKGVADRITDYQDFRHMPHPECGEECHDEVMLKDLQTYIDAHPEGDILIAMHQLGSHGPEYYKRYPDNFEYFTPVCKTNKLGDCTAEEITNAYDNTIRYTDHFLANIIHLIEKNDDDFEAAMLYVSDHGESLGENGVYLHGMPYTFAPEAQKHVGVIYWAGKHADFPAKSVIPLKDSDYTQDQLYCTLLSLFEVETKDCKSNMTIFRPDMAKHSD